MKVFENTKTDKYVRYRGDILSSEGGNFIPILAILYAAISSINSVGVSIYQEQLYKVTYTYTFVIILSSPPCSVITSSILLIASSNSKRLHDVCVSVCQI